MYAALAATFVWLTSESKPLARIIAVAAMVITALMWLADVRNRAALRASKDAGAAIEEHQDANVPTDQRFIARLKTESYFDKFVTHSRAIDVFAIAMIILLGAATWYLLSHSGVLPK